MTQMIVDNPRLFCTFRLNGQLFGVEATDVKEISTEPPITAIAHVPQEVLGLVNIRGHIYLVLDLRCLLGMPRCGSTQDSRLILFKPSVGNAFGVIVDSISEMTSVESDQIEPFSAAGEESSHSRLSRVELISAICKQGDELIVLLNPGRFLAVIEQSFDTIPQ